MDEDATEDEFVSVVSFLDEFRLDTLESTDRVLVCDADLEGSPNYSESKKPKKTPKFASTQARQRYQKLTLESQVEQLEAVLQLMTRRQTGSSALGSPGGESTDCHTALVALRKSVVERQREQLKRSEKENRQLRASLLEQRKLARDLHRVLVSRESKNAVRRRVCVSTASLCVVLVACLSLSV